MIPPACPQPGEKRPSRLMMMEQTEAISKIKAQQSTLADDSSKDTPPSLCGGRDADTKDPKRRKDKDESERYMDTLCTLEFVAIVI